MRGLLLALLSGVSAAAGSSWIVNPEGTGSFPTIQAAVDGVAPGDTILLLEGVFCGPGNRNICFQGKLLVLRSLYGDPAHCILDCSGNVEDSAAVRRGFLFEDSESSAASIEGISILNGRATTVCPGCMGGAVFCLNGSNPTFRNCVFGDNEASDGGAVACITACPSFVDCTFFGNSAVSGDGGAVYCVESGPRLLHCTISGNSAEHYGGGVFAYYVSAPTLRGCRIIGNQALHGGGLYCDLQAYPAVDSTLFYGNEASAFGGAIYMTDSHPAFTYCTVDSNAAIIGGNVASRYGSAATMYNCIISFAAQGEGLFCDLPTCVPAMACCDIYGNAGGDWIGHILPYLGQAGNVAVDPLYCREASPQLPWSLQSGSPCLPPHSSGCGLIGAFAEGCATGSIPSEPPSRSRSAELSIHPNPGWSGCEFRIRLEGAHADESCAGEVLDVAGQVVARIASVRHAGGWLEGNWRAADPSGRPLPSGAYFIRAKGRSAAPHSGRVIVF